AIPTAALACRRCVAKAVSSGTPLDSARPIHSCKGAAASGVARRSPSRAANEATCANTVWIWVGHPPRCANARVSLAVRFSGRRSTSPVAWARGIPVGGVGNAAPPLLPTAVAGQPRNVARGARIALGRDLAPQLSGIAAATRPVPHEVAVIGRQDPA